MAANETPSALIDPSRPGKALVAAGLLFVLAACGSTPAGTKPTSKGPRYTVGGTATGIRGEVVLLKNQADRLSVNQDGPFVFAEPLAQGAAFEVTIVSTPRRTACVVENGDGVVGDSDVLSVVLRCRSWQHGPPISLAGMRPPKRGQVAAALADNGDAVVAWHAMVRTRYRLSRGVFVAERRDGEWRQAARMLPGESPRLGVDASGHTILSSFDPENDVIYHMTYRSNRWLGPERIRDAIGPGYLLMSPSGIGFRWWLQRFDDPPNDTKMFRQRYWDGSWGSKESVADVMDAHRQVQRFLGATNAGGDVLLIYSTYGGRGLAHFHAGAWHYAREAPLRPANAATLQPALTRSGVALACWSHDRFGTPATRVFCSINAGNDWVHPTPSTEALPLHGAIALLPGQTGAPYIMALAYDGVETRASGVAYGKSGFGPVEHIGTFEGRFPTVELSEWYPRGRGGDTHGLIWQPAAATHHNHHMWWRPFGRWHELGPEDRPFLERAEPLALRMNSRGETLVVWWSWTAQAIRASVFE